MSAYICNPEHFAALASFAVQHRSCVWTKEDPRDSARTIAEELAKENIRSVNARYNEGDNCEEIVKKAGDYAEKFFFRAPKLTAMDVLKMCSCYEYQSCETDDWKDTMASRQIEWIKSAAIRSLPGYESAIRDFRL